MSTVVRFAPMPGISRTAIDRAGAELRRWWMSNEAEFPPPTVDAIGVMIACRETFQLPLNKTVAGLRSMVCSECAELKASGSRILVSRV